MVMLHSLLYKSALVVVRGKPNALVFNPPPLSPRGVADLRHNVWGWLGPGPDLEVMRNCPVPLLAVPS